jgi:hypothetical protein
MWIPRIIEWRYPGVMTAASHASEVHRMVDRLAPAQLEALYVLLRGMMGRLGGAQPAAPATAAPAAAAPAAAAPAAVAGHRFSFIGIMDGEPDLAERSARILREELGDPPA